MTSQRQTSRSPFLRLGRLWRIPAAGAIVCVGLAAAWFYVELRESSRLAADTRVVVRVSNDLIGELLRNEIREEFPIEEETEAFTVTGTADAVGDVSVSLAPALDPETGHAVFLIRVNGTTLNDFEALRSPVQVLASGKGDFTAVKRVLFDGRRFHEEETQITATHETTVESIEPLPGTPLGGAVRLLAVRDVRKALPELNAIAEQRIREKLSARIEELLTESLNELKKANPVEEAVAMLHPDARDWRVELALKPDYVMASLVPSGGKLPMLPVRDDQLQEDFDVWVRLTGSEQMGLSLLQQWQGRQLFKWLLPDGAVRAFGEKAQFSQVGDWTRMRFAAPARPAVTAGEVPQHLARDT
jgi:hypothetical protein